jgi:hypothetical protein
VVDEFSRRAHEVHVTTINMYKTNLKDKTIAIENSDMHYLKIKETIQ